MDDQIHDDWEYVFKTRQAQMKLLRDNVAKDHLVAMQLAMERSWTRWTHLGQFIERLQDFGDPNELDEMRPY
jgi:hypothetical protein